MFEHIVVPTDGSDNARNAVENAIRIAKRFDSTIHTIYVVNMGDADYVAIPTDIAETRDRIEEKGREFTEEVEELAEGAGVECETDVRTGVPEQEILTYAEETGADLIVMGKRGRGDPDKPMLGSITKRVVGGTDALVLTV